MSDIKRTEREVGGEGEGLDAVDLLIERLLDGDAAEAPWDEFRRLASVDQDLWRRLGEAHALSAALSAAVAAETAAAMKVELPAVEGANGFEGRRLGPGAWARQYGGWAAAAAIGLAWMGFALDGGRGPTNRDALVTGPMTGSAEGSGAVSSDALLASYLQSPRVWGELPPMVVGRTGTSENGEVVYIRPIVERRQVNGTAELAWDETASPRLRKSDLGQVVRASY